MNRIVPDLAGVFDRCSAPPSFLKAPFLRGIPFEKRDRVGLRRFSRWSVNCQGRLNPHLPDGRLRETAMRFQIGVTQV